MVLIRLLRGHLRDRAGRAAAAVAAGWVLLAPRVAAVASGGGSEVDAGLRAGLSAGSPGAGLLGLILPATALFLWEGIVGRDVREGWFRMPLARPVWRPGYFLSRHLAALVLTGAAAGLLWAGLRPVPGAAQFLPSAGGTVAAALAVGWAVGGAVFLCSAVLARGDALLAAALLLLPGALHSLGSAGWLPQGPVAAVLPLLPPVAALREIRLAAAAGGLPGLGEVALAFAYGTGTLALSLLVLSRREFH